MRFPFFFVFVMLLFVVDAERSMVDEVKGLKIIAFGDSLTAGYWKGECPGNRRTRRCPTSPPPYLSILSVNRSQLDPFYHSYAHKLRALLQNTSTVVEVGKSGERTDEMLFRLPLVLRQHMATTKVVIILGGTNDLGFGRMQPADIVENIKQLHRLAFNSSTLSAAGHRSVVYTVAVTLPPSQWTQRPPHAAKRLDVNGKIRAFAGRCAAWMAFVDLEPVFDLNVEKSFAKYYSPDGLHFNPHGYDTFGELLFKAMSSFAVKDGPFSLDCLKE